MWGVITKTHTQQVEFFQRSNSSEQTYLALKSMKIKCVAVIYMKFVLCTSNMDCHVNVRSKGALVKITYQIGQGALIVANMVNIIFRQEISQNTQVTYFPASMPLS